MVFFIIMSSLLVSVTIANNKSLTRYTKSPYSSKITRKSVRVSSDSQKSTSIVSRFNNYWSFNNNLIDQVTGKVLIEMQNVSFTDNRFGEPNKALAFNEGNVKIDTYMNSVQFLVEYSISLWVNIMKSEPFAKIFSCGLSGVNELIIQETELFEGITIQIYTMEKKSSITSLFVYEENTWFHLAITQKAKDISIYSNGILQENTKVLMPYIINLEKATCMFGSSSKKSGKFNGYLDDVIFFGFALTEAQLKETMNYTS